MTPLSCSLLRGLGVPPTIPSVLIYAPCIMLSSRALSVPMWPLDSFTTWWAVPNSVPAPVAHHWLGAGCGCRWIYITNWFVCIPLQPFPFCFDFFCAVGCPSFATPGPLLVASFAMYLFSQSLRSHNTQAFVVSTASESSCSTWATPFGVPATSWCIFVRNKLKIDRMGKIHRYKMP